MLIFLILVIIILLFLLLRRNSGSRNTYGYSRPEPPTYGDNFGNGMGRGLGMFAGGLAAGALLSYLWEQGRLNEDQYHYFNSLSDEEAIRQLQEQNLLQQEEIDDLQNRLRYDDPPQYDQDDTFDNDYDDNSNGFNDGGNDDDSFI